MIPQQTACWPPGLSPLLASAWLDASALVGLLTPLVIVPLGVITFYLRGWRDQQFARQDDLGRRLDQLDGYLHKLDHRLTDMERDFTAKEDWLRESMLARQHLDRLSAALARLEGGLAAARGGDWPAPQAGDGPLLASLNNAEPPAQEKP